MTRVLAAMLMGLLASASFADPVALAAINAERGAQGRAPLIYDEALERAARIHAQDMAANGFFRMKDRTGLTSVSVWQLSGIGFVLAPKTSRRASRRWPR